MTKRTFRIKVRHGMTKCGTNVLTTENKINTWLEIHLGSSTPLKRRHKKLIQNVDNNFFTLRNQLNTG